MSKAPSSEDVIQFWASIALDAHAPASAQAEELREVARQLIHRKGVNFARDIALLLPPAMRFAAQDVVSARAIERKRRQVERIIRARRDGTESLELLLQMHLAEELEHPKLDDVRSARSRARARRFIRIYEFALKAITVDPLARFLASRPYPPRARGNPKKRLNAAIASLLRDEGLLQREIEAVLFAIGFKDRRSPR